MCECYLISIVAYETSHLGPYWMSVHIENPSCTHAVRIGASVILLHVAEWETLGRGLPDLLGGWFYLILIELDELPYKSLSGDTFGLKTRLLYRLENTRAYGV